jgi:hypothetical protein
VYEGHRSVTATHLRLKCAHFSIPIAVYLLLGLKPLFYKVHMKKKAVNEKSVHVSTFSLLLLGTSEGRLRQVTENHDLHSVINS